MNISPLSSLTIQPSPYVCDTIPPARLVSADSFDTDQILQSPPLAEFDIPTVEDVAVDVAVEVIKPETVEKEIPSAAAPPARRLCVRHQRMADEGTNLKLQQVGTTSPLRPVRYASQTF